jgi:chromosome segregation ATPase
MKIDGLYTELGYEDFESYAEKEFDLKRRQAYQYISVYEKLGKEFVQSNAQLGITKLALLATANPEDRAEVMESGDVGGMTTRELEDLLDKYKQQGEQLSLLQEENTKLEAKVEELESAPKDVQVATKEIPVPDKETEEQLRKKTKELAAVNAEKDSIKKELNSVNAELQLEKTTNDRLRKEMNAEIAEKVKKEVAAETKKQAKELKQKETELQNARAMKEQAEQEKKALEKKISELEQAAQKPPENADKSNFKVLLSTVYRDMLGLVEFIKDTEDIEERKQYFQKALEILHICEDSIKKIDFPAEIPKQPLTSRGVVDINNMKPITSSNAEYDDGDDGEEEDDEDE